MADATIKIRGGAGNAVQIQSRNIDATAPSDGQALAWSSSDSEWEPTTVLNGIDDQSSSSSDQITITDTEVVINEDHDANMDFRVEGDTLAHLLFVDSSADKVGINTSTPASLLEINAGAANNIEAFSITEYDGHNRLAVEADFATNGNPAILKSSSQNPIMKIFTTSGRVEAHKSALIKAKAQTGLTGSIDPAASTTVTGVETQFLSQVAIGDSILVSGETRVVTAIASDTSLTVSVAFSDNANDDSPDVLPCPLTVQQSNGSLAFAINSSDEVIVNNDATINGLTVGLGLAGVTSNTAVGKDALSANTTGERNTACGAEALKANTEGDYNTASGYAALTANTTGDKNTANGDKSLFWNTTGASNTASGHASLFTNTTGTSNTASGHDALKLNTTGSGNTASGREALHSNTTGNYNTASGYAALYSNTEGEYNTASGRLALYSNTTGGQNTANGHQALYSNTTGTSNAANGQKALYSNTEGVCNTASGRNTLRSNTTGNYNTASGNQALYSNTEGDNNAASGYQALYYNTTGSKNTAFGRTALLLNTEGDYNTACGQSAGSSITEGDYNTCLGHDAEPSSATVDGEFVLGDSNVGTLRCNTSTISALSDARDKTEVEPSTLGVDFLNKLNPVKFLWDTREGNSKDGTHEIGFIAQELQAVQKESNTEFLKMVIDENPERLEASYGQLVPILVQAIKELSAQVKELQSA